MAFVPVLAREIGRPGLRAGEVKVTAMVDWKSIFGRARHLDGGVVLVRRRTVLGETLELDELLHQQQPVGFLLSADPESLAERGQRLALAGWVPLLRELGVPAQATWDWVGEPKRMPGGYDLRLTRGLRAVLVAPTASADLVDVPEPEDCIGDWSAAWRFACRFVATLLYQHGRPEQLFATHPGQTNLELIAVLSRPWDLTTAKIADCGPARWAAVIGKDPTPEVKAKASP